MCHFSIQSFFLETVGHFAYFDDVTIISQLSFLCKRLMRNFTHILAAVHMGCSKFVIRESFYVVGSCSLLTVNVSGRPASPASPAVLVFL